MLETFSISWSLGFSTLFWDRSSTNIGSQDCSPECWLIFCKFHVSKHISRILSKCVLVVRYSLGQVLWQKSLRGQVCSQESFTTSSWDAKQKVLIEISGAGKVEFIGKKLQTPQQLLFLFLQEQAEVGHLWQDWRLPTMLKKQPSRLNWRATKMFLVWQDISSNSPVDTVNRLLLLLQAHALRIKELVHNHNRLERQKFLSTFTFLTKLPSLHRQDCSNTKQILCHLSDNVNEAALLFYLSARLFVSALWRKKPEGAPAAPTGVVWIRLVRIAGPCAFRIRFTTWTEAVDSGFSKFWVVSTLPGRAPFKVSLPCVTQPRG